MIQLVKNIIDANAITHAGSFHADDIFATIFLSKLMNVKLYRAKEINEKEILDGKIVYDIGFGKFDHHGKNARVRENGLKYSAFGLLFETYGKDYLKKEGVTDINCCYETFLHDFILQIDAIDNGFFPKSPNDYSILTLSELIECFNKTWNEEKTSDDAFLEGLKIGELIFNQIKKRIFAKVEAKNFVEEAIEKSKEQILILDQYMPYMEWVLESKNKKSKELLFCIYPSNRGGFNIQAIHKNKKSNENRLDFPKKWGGKSREELIRLTSIKTFHFCHINLFLCACNDFDDAIKIAKLAINEK